MQVNEIKVVYKPTDIKVGVVTKSSVAADIARRYYASHLDGIEYREHFIILCLDRANQVRNIYHVGTGGVAGVIVDAKIIFSAALRSNTSAIILVHNHPSGNKQPSRADLDLTHKLIAGGKLLDIVVLDHIIITEYDYYSMADNEDI